MIDVAAKRTPVHCPQRSHEARADADRHAEPDVKRARLEIAGLCDRVAVAADSKPIVALRHGPWYRAGPGLSFCPLRDVPNVLSTRNVHAISMIYLGIPQSIVYP